jgi:hypothetical protein
MRQSRLLLPASATPQMVTSSQRGCQIHVLP